MIAKATLAAFGLVALIGACGRPQVGDGSVDSPGSFDCLVADVTITVRDLADGAVVEVERYASLDHGFTLDLARGRYDIELADAHERVFARWADVKVDGHVTLPVRTQAIASAP